VSSCRDRASAVLGAPSVRVSINYGRGPSDKHAWRRSEDAIEASSCNPGRSVTDRRTGSRGHCQRRCALSRLGSVVGGVFGSFGVRSRLRSLPPSCRRLSPVRRVRRSRRGTESARRGEEDGELDRLTSWRLDCVAHANSWRIRFPVERRRWTAE
jgi:hypothetical protein